MPFNFWRPLLLGIGTVVAFPLVLLLVNAILGRIFDPLIDILGVSFPHGYLAAGLTFLGWELLVENADFLKTFRLRGK